MSDFTFIDLFAGIGGFHQAGAQLGGTCVFACEIDEHAKKAYAHNYGIVPYGDITTLNENDVPDHDILFAGFPCQPFSIIGSQMGFEDTRGTLFFEIVRILNAKRPSAFILENVKQLKTHDNGRTFNVIIKQLKALGYDVYPAVLNALDYGLPQKRERTIIVGFAKKTTRFAFPKPTGKGNLVDVLEEDSQVDKKHFASEDILKKRMEKHQSEFYPSIWHENVGGNVSSHPFSCALRAGASYNYLLVNGKRRLTPREMLRLQGFPDSFEIVCSDAQTRKQAGNAVPVNMIKAVLKEVLYARSAEAAGREKEYRPRAVPSWRNTVTISG
ncbi:MAG: DNA (cytosine-5-)-methyltransferase [Clostridiales Family XIII bacterium]|jgi:DNA (cytosine-5)-methyltransferase 1|nr:DNA (cytosine-5-)-methyltransferase [Clostridiales Family XIII bacterium]